MSVKKKHRRGFRRQRHSKRKARRRGSGPREAIERSMTIPKRNCVCKNRWQPDKKIRRSYCCFKHHFRQSKLPKHRRIHKHTLTHAALLWFLPNNPANTRPCVTHTHSFSEQDWGHKNNNNNNNNSVQPTEYCSTPPSAISHFWSVCVDTTIFFPSLYSLFSQNAFHTEQVRAVRAVLAMSWHLDRKKKSKVLHKNEKTFLSSTTWTLLS